MAAGQDLIKQVKRRLLLDNPADEHVSVMVQARLPTDGVAVQR